MCKDKIKTKIYVSLPITGHGLEEVKKRAGETKARLEKRGYEVTTPFDVRNEENRPYVYYMGKDIEALLGCDAVYMCRGWQSSKGCKAELAVANIYEKDVLFEKGGEG